MKPVFLEYLLKNQEYGEIKKAVIFTTAFLKQ